MTTTYTKNTARYTAWYYGINMNAEPKKATAPTWKRINEENKEYTNVEKNYKKY